MRKDSKGGWEGLGGVNLETKAEVLLPAAAVSIDLLREAEGGWDPPAQARLLSHKHKLLIFLYQTQDICLQIKM